MSDAYKPKKPLDPSPDDSELRTRGRWSSSLRPVPFDGGCLPVIDVAKAVLETGFRGWFSMEIFEGGPDGQGQGWKDMPAVYQESNEVSRTTSSRGEDLDYMESGAHQHVSRVLRRGAPCGGECSVLLFSNVHY